MNTYEKLSTLTARPEAPLDPGFPYADVRGLSAIVTARQFETAKVCAFLGMRLAMPFQQEQPPQPPVYDPAAHQEVDQSIGQQVTAWEYLSQIEQDELNAIAGSVLMMPPEGGPQPQGVLQNLLDHVSRRRDAGGRWAECHDPKSAEGLIHHIFGKKSVFDLLDSPIVGNFDMFKQVADGITTYGMRLFLKSGQTAWLFLNEPIPGAPPNKNVGTFFTEHPNVRFEPKSGRALSPQEYEGAYQRMGNRLYGSNNWPCGGGGEATVPIEVPVYASDAVQENPPQTSSAPITPRTVSGSLVPVLSIAAFGLGAAGLLFLRRGGNRNGEPAR